MHQQLLFNKLARKFDKPFKGKFKWAADERFYGNIQDIISLIEEAFYCLESELPPDAKSWDPLKELASKVKTVDEDIVTAQVSPHGWSLVDRFNNMTKGFHFIQDEDKAKKVRELEKELSKEKKGQWTE